MTALIEATTALQGAQFSSLRHRMIFECHKWDPQVEDVCTIAPFALTISQGTWAELSRSAEGLAAETQLALSALSRRTDLHANLGLPRALCKALRNLPAQEEASTVSVQRFDFHHTSDGWRISETNSDVPGGYVEASGLSRLMCEYLPGIETVPDPAMQLARAIACSCAQGGHVALVHATGYTDDRQVMLFLADQLKKLGLRVSLVSPDHLRWISGRAHLPRGTEMEPVDFVFRFFPAEWLPNLPSATVWKPFFSGALTPLCNPGATILTQSKRFPLVWDLLGVQLPLWRRLLPETRDPREVGWSQDDSWILKPALGRVGEKIGLRNVISVRDWHDIALDARWFPGRWAAQRRFETPPVQAGGAAMYPCLGIYTVNGVASGIYGRISATPLINHMAIDCAVVLRTETRTATGRNPDQ